MREGGRLLLLPLLFIGSKRLQTLLEGLLLLFAQQHHTAGLGLKLVEVVTRLLMFFKDLCGNLAVNFGAG